MTVYVDVLLATNLFINCMLLAGARRILHCDVKTPRLLAASFIGALYSLIIFADALPDFARASLNIAVLSVITLVAFRPKSIKSFLKYTAAFLLVNFLFAGLMLALWFFVKPDKMLYNNFVVYFDIDVKLLIILSAACYLVLRLITAFIRHISPPKKTVSVTLTHRMKSVTVSALVDTGNTLADGFSGEAVIIADKSVTEKLAGESLYALTEKQTAGVTKDFERIRLIPVSTVSSQSLLAAIKLEEMTVGNVNFGNVLLAESRSPLNPDCPVIISEHFNREE